MKTNEKYVAILFEKLNYDVNNGMFIFRPLEVLSECKVDFKNNILTSQTGKEYFNMDDETLVCSEENICYGYPMLIDELRNYYSELPNDEDIIKSYFEDINSTIYFGLYDNKLKKIKSILAPKNELNEMDDEQWFYDFVLDSDEENMPEITISNDALNQLINCLENNDIATVNEFLRNIKTVITTFTSSYDYEEINTEDNITYEVKQINEDKKDENVDLQTSLNKLDNLVGLENIKKEVKNLIDYLFFVKKVGNNVNLPTPNLHMFFTGNPGQVKQQ